MRLQKNARVTVAGGVMAKRVKPQNTHETIALRLLRAARRIRLTNVTDEELLEGMRARNPVPQPPPPLTNASPILNTKEWEALMRMLLDAAAARSQQAYRNASPQGTPGAFPGFPPFPRQIPPQIPPPAPRVVPWRVILGIPQDKPVTTADVHARWLELTKIYHPDKGGSKEGFQAITDARDYAIRELGSR